MNSFGEKNIADSLFMSGDYFQASIEYERTLFYSESRATNNYCLYQKALCYKNTGDYTRALNELQGIYISSSTDSLFAPLSYQLAFCLYLNNEPLRALWKIDEFINRTKDTLSYINFIPLKVLCLNEQQEWEKAKTELIYFLKNTSSDTTVISQMLMEVDDLYSKKAIPRLVEVKKAQNMSRFLPGLGQVYAGKVGEGIVNLLINTSILAFSAHQFYFKYYITGYLAGLALLNKVYQNGVTRAGVVAKQTNEKRIKAFNQQTTTILKHSIN